ncbi:MAG: DUF58 domain-containing protein [Gammaproteobacteria bacterium]|nr:DUF58 domain-containing protein [Gammaproteobacteria bacterium]
MNALTVSAPATLDRRSVYIFLTRHGLLFGLAQLLILAGAINYDNALAYLLAFLLGGLLLVGMLHTWRNLAGLALVGVETRPVFAGEDALFALRLDNRAGPRRPGVDAVAVAGRRPGWRGPPERGTVSRHALAAAAIDEVTVAIPSAQRGWLALERVKLESVYPLGVLRAWAYLPAAARCLVYPRPIGRLPLPIGGGGGTDHRGGGAGHDDFAGLRDYVPGDATRAIHWKSLARHGEVLVKRFEGLGGTTASLSWDAAAAAGGIEPRLSQLARWVLDAEQAGLAYALLLPGLAIPAARGPAQRERCLEALALFGGP